MIEGIIKNIHEIVQAYDKFDSLIDIIRFVIIISSIIAVLSFRKLKKSIRKIHLHRLVGFKKRLPIEVILPTFAGNLDYTPEETINRGTSSIRMYDYITLQESETLLYLHSLVNDYGIKADIRLKGSNDSFTIQSNKIVIGGPLNNLYLHDIFSQNSNGIYTFGGRFKFGVKHYWSTRKRNDLFSDIQEIVSDNENLPQLFYWDKNGNKNSIAIPHRYVILIKLNKKDIKLSNTGPMLICFGESSLTTNKSVQCLTESVYDLSKCIKNKKHFFIIFRCTSHGDIQFTENDGIIDLTDVML